MRLCGYLNHFLEEVHCPSVSPNTYAVSAQFVRLYFSNYAVADRRLKDLTRGDLQKYFNYLCVWVSPVTKRTPAPATVEWLCRVLTAALNRAYNDQLIAQPD